MRRLLTATALSLVLVGPGYAREAYALLVGASTYPNLEERYWLKGPANDVILARTYLETNPTLPFAPENVTVLADGVEGSTPPTLAAIRTAFADIATQAQAGDFVYLHFSGHGSQAPALDDPTELDGLDELFLPVDIGPWDYTSGFVQNALVDDEIGRMIDAIRAKGADVWAVFDSCYSGTVTRAAPSGDEEVRMRQLPPEALGIPVEAMDAAEANAVATRGLPDPAKRADAPLIVQEPAGYGSLTAFFAAQTIEVTPEMRLPKNDLARVSHGVFTYTLFEAMAEYPGITYRQLGQEVLRKYSVFNLARSTPMFEGNLDAVVFGGAETGRVAQWPARPADDALRIDAGTLHGISEGARLAVMRSPADPEDQALGFVQVTRADTFRSMAVAVDGDGAIALADVPKGAFLRKLGNQIDFTLTVALPDGDSAPAQAMRAAARALVAAGEAGTRLTFVDAGDDADLRLAVLPDSPRPDAIWILPGSGLIDAAELPRTPSVSTADKTVDELAATIGDNFKRMGKAINLLKVGAASGGTGLTVSAELRKSRFDPISETVDATTRARLDISNVPRLIPNDVIGLRLENTSDGPIDFNIFYVGSDYSVSFMEGGQGRMNPGDTRDDDYVLIEDQNFGRDRLVVILTPAENGTPVEDLRFLEQSAVEVTRSLTGADLNGILYEAGFGETTRGAVSLNKKKDKGKSPMILQYELDTVPGN